MLSRHINKHRDRNFLNNNVGKKFKVQEWGRVSEGLPRRGGREHHVAKASCGEGPWRGHVRRGAPDLARKGRPKSQGHTRSVPPRWPRPGSGRAGTAGPRTGLQAPRPGCTGPPSTHPGTGSCRKERRGAHTSRGHTWRRQRKSPVRTGQGRAKAPTRGCPAFPALASWGGILFPRLKHGGKL